MGSEGMGEDKEGVIHGWLLAGCDLVSLWFDSGSMGLCVIARHKTKAQRKERLITKGGDILSTTGIVQCTGCGAHNGAHYAGCKFQ